MKYRDRLKTKPPCSSCGRPTKKIVPVAVGSSSGAKGGIAGMCKACARKRKPWIYR